MLADVRELFFSSEVARLTGLRERMLDYLCRTGISVPSLPGSRGRGKRRLYSFGDVVFLKAVARLLKAGVSVKRMKDSFANVSKTLTKFDRASAITGFLLTDGVEIYFKESDSRVIELASGQCCFAFLIELSGIQKEVVDEVARLPKRA
jgi:DNA-binding transcriptional MerR regulator